MKAVFFDKDGTLIQDVPYSVDPSLIKMKAFGGECLTKIKDLNYLVFIITNQSGVARGFFEEHDLALVESKLRQIMSAYGVTLSGFYYCPHHPKGSVKKYAIECECRKPGPGLIKMAAKDFGISLSESWMIGDKLEDVEAGRKAGCKTILLDDGRTFNIDLEQFRTPDFVVQNLYEAALIIERTVD